jgi:hypothetical protein
MNPTMATKPTRMQSQARDRFADALVLITEGARLDGKGTLDRNALGEVAMRLAAASSAFSLDDIISRAVERRVQGLGLPSSAGDLLSLMEEEVTPLETLLLSDDEFRSLIASLEEELGEL